ncbi:hypothetical protein BDR05DRAFT_977663 [Suillus weaverae]|nr:hypothetical protein BDR05DRAFT_977663 [Suillus weaverae]
MEPRLALELRCHQPVTPYKHTIWEDQLLVVLLSHTTPSSILMTILPGGTLNSPNPPSVAPSPNLLPSSTSVPSPMLVHPSALQLPHCLVRDRLRLWVPPVSRLHLDHTGSEVAISESDLVHILTETYGSGLLVFHVFSQCCPASSILILAFIALCAGMYSGKMLENYLYSPWLAHHDQVSSALEGGKHLAPPTSTRPKRAAFTVELLSNLHAAFDLTTPLHAAVYACLTTSFFTLMHMGEFTVPSLQRFDPAIHVKTDRNGFEVTVFHLPRTKVALAGEDVYWAAQSGVIDPQATLTNHLTINKPLTNHQSLMLCSAGLTRMGCSC